MAQFIQVKTTQDIDDIIMKSNEKPQIIFKHSTACPISKISYEKMQSQYPLSSEQADLYYIGVIEQRDLSNYVAEKLDLKHESPQVMVIEKGKVVFHESHLMIDPVEMGKYV